MERCIKGTVFETVVAEVREAIDSGALPGPAGLQLAEEDLDYLEQKVQASSWYPIAAHDRLLRLLLRHVGQGNLGYWIEGGRKAADALRSSGLYEQLSDETSKRLGLRAGRVLVSLSGAVYNFTRWRWDGWVDDDDTFQITVSEAEGFPDSCRYRAVGFIERAAGRALGHYCRCTSRRPSPDMLVYLGRRIRD